MKKVDTHGQQRWPCKRSSLCAEDQTKCLINGIAQVSSCAAVQELPVLLCEITNMVNYTHTGQDTT